MSKNALSKKDGLQMTSKDLTEISKDEAERVAYIEHLFWTTDQESKILFAEKKGKLKEKYETAQKMLVKGKYSTDEISDCTGLSVEDIEKLRNELGNEKCTFKKGWCSNGF